MKLWRNLLRRYGQKCPNHRMRKKKEDEVITEYREKDIIINYTLNTRR